MPGEKVWSERHQGKPERGEIPGVIIHDDGHAVQAQPVRLGHHTLSEPVSDVVRAQQADDDDHDVDGDEGKRGGKPALQNQPLPVQVALLVAGKDRPGIACGTDGGFNKRAVIPAAFQLVLDAQTSVARQLARPLQVDLALEVDSLALVCNVSRV